MNQELVKVFQNDKFGNIRVVLISGKEHFVASDVAKALGYERPADAVAQHCVNSVKHRVENSRGQMIEKVLTDPDLIIKLATQLKEEKAARLVAEQKIEEQKPKVAFTNAITASTNSILIRELARLISQNGVDMGEKNSMLGCVKTDMLRKTHVKLLKKLSI